MTVTDTIKEAVGLGDGGRKSCPPKVTYLVNIFDHTKLRLDTALMNLPTTVNPPQTTPASREAMSAARLPIPYRDSCAHLLIPLNRCRFEEYYLPWKCEVRWTPSPAREASKESSAVEETNVLGAETGALRDTDRKT